MLLFVCATGIFVARMPRNSRSIEQRTLWSRDIRNDGASVFHLDQDPGTAWESYRGLCYSTLETESYSAWSDQM